MKSNKNKILNGEHMKNIEEMKKIEEWLNKNNVYVVASVDGKGVHIGRFKGLSLDADDDLIIEVDIDSLSCTS